jgi:AraC-like DNA-binding protein
MPFEYALDNMEVRTKPFALCELRGECDLNLGRRPSATLHYFLAGQGEISLSDRQSIPVQKGMLVLVPALHSHTLRSFGDGGEMFPQCSPEKLNLATHVLESKDPDQGGQLVALCAQVTVSISGVSDVIDFVREPIAERIDTDSRVRASLKSIVTEVSNPSLGSTAMIRALLLQCMIEILRNRLNARDRALIWMGALADQNVWKALCVMLDTPGEPHTVESLADVVGMSRSTFAKHFADAYGNGPMEFLRNTRVQRSAVLLENTSLPVKRVAEMVGFRSRSAFSRMFERSVGLSPQKFRNDQRSRV